MIMYKSLFIPKPYMLKTWPIKNVTVDVSKALEFSMVPKLTPNAKIEIGPKIYFARLLCLPGIRKSWY